MPFDPTREGQLTEDQLKMGYWWVTHRIQIRKAGTAALAVFGFALCTYAAWGFIDWFLVSGVAERNGTALLTKDLTNYSYFREQNAAKDLSLGSVYVIPSGANEDLVAKVTNPNPKWWADFTYSIKKPDGSDLSTTDTILPGETKYAAVYGADPASGREMKISAVSWHRVDGHVITPDYPAWAKARLNFDISGAKFVPAAPTDPLKVSKAVFTVTNDTAFGYWSPRFDVALESSGAVVGINKATVSELRPGEKREVEVSWFNEVPGVDHIDVRPEINIFDDKVYIPAGR